MSNKLLTKLEQIEQDKLVIEFELQPMPNNDEIIQVIVKDQEEFPINITQTDGEMICMVKLFDAEELKDGASSDMHEVMLSANLALPLSSFGKIGATYMLFGALSANSKNENIGIEIETLAGNTLEAIDLVADYLK
ncbi:MAG: DUF2170 family protein [Rhizobiales bacterium]|nr:DUF2170 family protein [Hyphomicrobiales bacterium]